MRLRGQVRIEWVTFASLQDNPLGDPAERAIPVYLPPGYEEGGPYPVIYWLHGFTGTGLGQANYNPWVPSLPELMDRVIAEGAPPALLVMADGFTRYGGSQYLNSSATGRYEDALLELVGVIDSRYKTRPAARHRGLDGKSSGGYGALVQAMRHPEVFGAVASHSGDMYFEACYKPAFWKGLDTVRKHGGLEAFLRAFDAAPKKPQEMVEALVLLVAMAMAYSPNPAAPLGFDLPVDVETGELDEAVWARWLAWDPVVMVERHADALRGMRLVYIECGSRDQFALHYGARILHRRLERLGVPHEHQEFDDDHTAVNYRYVESLRRLCHALAS